MAPARTAASRVVLPASTPITVGTTAGEGPSSCVISASSSRSTSLASRWYMASPPSPNVLLVAGSRRQRCSSLNAGASQALLQHESTISRHVPSPQDSVHVLHRSFSLLNEVILFRVSLLNEAILFRALPYLADDFSRA
eukprot:3599644-Prymnesium_polylepis.1